MGSGEKNTPVPDEFYFDDEDALHNGFLKINYEIYLHWATPPHMNMREMYTHTELALMLLNLDMKLFDNMY